VRVVSDSLLQLCSERHGFYCRTNEKYQYANLSLRGGRSNQVNAYSTDSATKAESVGYHSSPHYRGSGFAIVGCIAMCQILKMDCGLVKG
jgi:hypothetical protein